MAVNYLTFGGIRSIDHFVWITGSGTYSAPERDAEFVSVPGRNGDLVIDNGKWRNIIVTYPAFIPYDFENHMRDFRAQMCRKLGYQRLEDTYHPDEFRLGTFVNGLDPAMRQWNKSGEFDLVFNCKPQRFLKAGETPIQFLTITGGSSSLTTGYIPVSSSLDYSVSCAAGDSLQLEFETFTNTGVPAGTHYKFNQEDGATGSQTFSSNEKYTRIKVTGFTDADAVEVRIQGDITVDGESMTLDARIARSVRVENPTGYPAKPLIEILAKQIPHVTITNYNDGEPGDVFDFYSSETPDSHLWLDCDLQYLYNDDKENLTNYLTITTAETAAGQPLVFPELSGDEIEIELVSPSVLTFDKGLSIVNIYPRWWTL